ncbi:hypothetical protein KEM55_001627 [Ascosphaera atra]|nr:hypothetical protein KEM55_001627 [Ascosphaera atra]
MSISSLEAVLAYVGSTGSTAISFILPGLFYYKISDPDSFHHQRLMKEDDDEAGMESGSDDERGAPYGTDAAPRRRSASEILSSPCLGANRHVLSRKWRHAVLRKMSLALAVYGFIVMGTCLTINTFFVASH